MKRDMDLIRTILLKVEADPTFDGLSQTTNIDAARLGIIDHSEKEVTYHIVQLIEAGLLAGNMKLAGISCLVVIHKLTWAGHDFLDTVRDPKIWEKTKKEVEAAGGFTFELVKDLAKGFIKKQIEELTGVKL